MDSRPLLESIGRSGQVEEKSLRQSVASLKQNLEDGEVSRFSWIVGTEIVVDVFMKQGSEREALDEIMLRSVFKHAQKVDNFVLYKDEEIKIKNLTTKAARGSEMDPQTEESTSLKTSGGGQTSLKTRS